jgi:hypothetical protein
MVSFAAAAAALVYALIRGSWGSGLTLGLRGLAAAALVVFGRAERRRRDPMLDLSLLRNSLFTTLLAAVALLPAAAWAALAYQSLWLRSVLGLRSPIQAGLLFLPMSLATLRCAGCDGQLAGRWSCRRRFVRGAVANWLRLATIS